MKQIFFVLAALALIGAGCGGPTPTDKVLGTGKTPAPVYKTAPDFALKDFHDQTVRLSDYRGKYVVLNFWASWCPFCVNEMPDLAKLQDEYKGKLTVIAVNRAEPLQTAKDFADRVGVRGKLLLLLDPKDSVYGSFGEFAMPLTVFIGTEGEVRHIAQEPLDLGKMKRRIQEAFSL